MAKLTMPKRRNVQDRRSWHGLAFIMESLVLMVFLVVSTAILMQVFSASRIHGDQAYTLSHAVLLASNEAERFVVEPSTDNVGYFTVEQGILVQADEAGEDTYVVTRSVEHQEEAGGILYRANIVVELRGEQLYELDTAQYRGNSEMRL